MKIAVIGANGQLGCDLCVTLKSAGHSLTEINHDETFDVSRRETVRAVLAGLQIDVVINTAAMHNVEQCEEDPTGAFAANSLGPRNLAAECLDNGSRLLHISTDYVFDGAKKKPYLESDLPWPLNVYGTSKLAGEHFVLCTGDRNIVLRTSGLYGRNPCRAKGMSFVDLMLKLAAERDEVRVVTDEILTPTNTEDVARQIATLLEHDLPPGLYHATAEGECSWHDFAAEIFRFNGSTVCLHEAGPDEFPAKVPRPGYSVLENGRLKEIGINVMPHWRDGLHRFLEARI